MAGRRQSLLLDLTTTGLLLAGALGGLTLAATAAPPPTPAATGKMLAVNNATSGTPGATAKPAASAVAPTPKEWSRAPVPNPTVDSPELDMMRRTIDALTPEQRQRFKENLIRWTNLSPEEKKTLREREEVRRTKMFEETEKALKDTGLNLSPEQKEQFTRRYGEERRAVEEKLRKEMDELRRPMVKDVISRLRAEFSPGGTPASTSPAPTGPAENPAVKP